MNKDLRLEMDISDMILGLVEGVKFDEISFSDIDAVIGALTKKIIKKVKEDTRTGLDQPLDKS